MKLFSPKEDIVLTHEEEALFADFLIKFDKIWEVQQKYFYNKINVTTRKLVNCKKEETEVLQDKVKTYLEIMSDFEKIKKKSLKNAQGVSTVKVVKDLFYWIQSKDVKTKNEIKLTADR